MGDAEKLSAPVLGGNGAADGPRLYLGPPVPDTDRGAGASGGRVCRQRSAGSGCGGRLWCPALGESGGRGTDALRADGELAQLFAGLSARLCGRPHDGRRSGGRQCSQRNAADGALFSGTAGRSLRAASAPLLSDAQHGLLHQRRTGAGRLLQGCRQCPPPSAGLGRESAGRSAGLAAGGGVPAGPLFAPHRPASGRERAHHRADPQQCVGVHPCRGADAQERAGAGSAVGAGGRIRAALSGADDPAGPAYGVQSALQPDGHLALPRPVRLLRRGGALYGSSCGPLLRAGSGRGGSAFRDRRWFVMQALERAAAVFCTACICAELAARFVGPGWGQKCIKAVAGLYILVAFADALPGAKAQLTVPKLPQAETASVGSLEDAILAQTEEELSRRLEDACLREAGIRVKLRITLCRTAEGVAASAVQVVPQGALTDARKQAVERLLTAQLQLEPESICWGEAVP